MTDLAPGTFHTAEDTPPTETDEQLGQFTFNATTYGVDVDSGAYSTCGTAFIACTTGRGKVLFAGQLDNDTAAAGTSLTPVIRTGGVVGSGTVVIAASDVYRLLNIGTDASAAMQYMPFTGLTPGTTYNVRLEHKVSAGIGTILNRRVTVEPST